MDSEKQEKTSSEFVLSGNYVHQLYEAYQLLLETKLQLKKAINNDSGTHPLYLPSFGFIEPASEKGPGPQREVAINALTQLEIKKSTVSAKNTDHQLPDEDEKPTAIPINEAGMLCASPETLHCVEQFNLAKQSFKQAIMAIRHAQKSPEALSNRVSRLINDEILEKGYRTEVLKKAMASVKISSLDLKRCYAQIRILPPDVDSLRWTWATTHSRVKKVTREEAIAMAKKLPDPQAISKALELLGQCHSGEVLARRIPLNNQLRANYTYFEHGERLRKSCPISGIVVLQQQQLPPYKWRDNPASLGEDNHTPHRSGIEKDVYIKSLSLHRYV